MAFGSPAIDSLVEKSTGGDSGAPEWACYRRSELIAGATPGASAAGRLTSLWRRDGAPGSGAAPGGTVRTPSRTTNGALRPYTNPAGGRKKMLQLAEVSAHERGSFLLWDRLLDISGLSGTSTSAQTVGGSLTRYTGGAGNIIVLDIYTAIGTATTVTASYTNQDGTASRTTSPVTVGGTGLQEACRSIILGLQQGDTGVRSVETVTLAASTGTAGDFGITIAHPLIEITRDVDQGGSWCALDGMVECATDACLYGLWSASSTAAPMVSAHFAWIDV